MRKFIMIFVLLIATSEGWAATINIPLNQPTIQAGIDAATSGDTVLVADGIYTGPGNRDIDFGGKAVVLMSENGPDVTIIDCDGNYYNEHRGFYFHSGEISATVVDGFTIRGGYASFGGGIHCTGNSSPLIQNNNISGNAASGPPSLINDIGFGGGIFCSGNSNPIIRNNTISSNAAIGMFYTYSDILGEWISRPTGTGGGI